MNRERRNSNRFEMLDNAYIKSTKIIQLCTRRPTKKKIQHTEFLAMFLVIWLDAECVCMIFLFIYFLQTDVTAIAVFHLEYSSVSNVVCSMGNFFLFLLLLFGSSFISERVECKTNHTLCIHFAIYFVHFFNCLTFDTSNCQSNDWH